MLNKIVFSYYTLAPLTALVQKTVKLLNAQLAEQQMVQTIVARIEPQLETALQAIGSSTKTPLTEIVAAADLRRDNSYRSLRDHVKAGLRRENENYRKACEALWPLFEKNGLQLYRIAKDKETAAIESLLADLSKPKYQAHVATVNISDWLNELDNDNKTYVTASAERSAARSADNTVLDAEAFNELKKSMEILENILNTMQAMGDPEGIDEIVAEVSQYISEANTAAKISKSNSPVEENEDITSQD